MTMSSFLINSNYIEPKFPPFEEYAQHHQRGGPGGGDGGPGGGPPGYQPPPAPAAQQHLPPPAPLPHAGGSRESPASYYPPRAAYPAAALYPAPGAAAAASEAAYPCAYRGRSSPEQPAAGQAGAKGPAHGLHAHTASQGLPPPRPAPPAPPRRCEVAPATPVGLPAGGSAPACPLLLADKSPAGPKGKEPVVYPWMKKIHVSAGTWRGVAWRGVAPLGRRAGGARTRARAGGRRGRGLTSGGKPPAGPGPGCGWVGGCVRACAPASQPLASSQRGNPFVPGVPLSGDLRDAKLLGQ